MVILSMSGIKTSISTFRYFKAYGFQCLRNYCHEALLSVLFFCTASFVCNKASAGVVSPNGRIVVEVQGDTSLAVKYIDGKSVCRAFTIPSLGVAVDGNSESGRWRVASMKSSRPLHECYTMQTGKRSECVNEGIEYIYACSYGTDGHGRLALRLYDDGIAFRYEIDGLAGSVVYDEFTTYRIPEGVERYIQRFDPSYENFFPKTTSGRESAAHSAYPALLRFAPECWALITEAGIGRCHAASSLTNRAVPTDYKVTLARNDRAVTGDWVSPWRVIIMGHLDDVVESTLVTDVSRPAENGTDNGWIKPGVVSWIYWAHNHGSRDFMLVKQYIDLACALRLPYALIDAEWDEMSNGGNIDDAIDYAASKGVKLMIWYNSSTAWVNNGAPGPFYRLNKPEDREREFAWLEKKGIAGVKIDFFDGDTQPTMEYCMDLLESAARHNLMVNFHGATIPRGWQRTYPNLMSVEGVNGAEWYNNRPVLTDRAGVHNTTLPFTRNVVGSMDYTPCAFSDSQHPHITTHAHELALTVVFESALQHLADRPESLLAQPEDVRNFFSSLPAAWDDTKLISGYPGKSVVMARRKGDSWWVGVLNGLDVSQEISFNLGFLGVGDYELVSFEDSGSTGAPWRISRRKVSSSSSLSLSALPRGGAVCAVRKVK